MLRIPSAGVPLSVRDILSGVFAGNLTAFQNDLARVTGARHTGLVSTGSAAFHLTLKALAERSARRDVILPAYTAPVVVLPVLKAGLRPVAADVSLSTFNIDPASVADRLSDDTLAVMPAHMFGIPCELDTLQAALQGTGATLIEDAASALGATLDGRMAGTIADAGFYSFHRGKQLSTLIGGAWVTDDNQLADGIRRQAAELRRPSFIQRTALAVKLAALALAVRPALYTALHPLLKRFKDTTPHQDFEAFAYTALQAGAGRSLLRRLKHIVDARNRRAQRAREILADAQPITLPDIPNGARPAYNHCPVLLPDRNTRDAALARTLNAGVECTTLYNRTIYAAYGIDPDDMGGRCPRAEELAERLLLIPCHPLAPMARVEQAAELVRNVALDR